MGKGLLDLNNISIIKISDIKISRRWFYILYRENMKNKTFFSLLLMIIILSACSGPLARQDIANYNDVVPGHSEQSEEDGEDKNKENMNEESDKKKEEESPFSKRYLEKPGHKDLAAEYEYAVIKTNMGDIKLEFYDKKSPITVNNFMNLAQEGFYDGTRFHRVIENFMIQGGDPLSKDDKRDNDGRGGPGYQFADEINDIPLTRGNIAMANAGPNTNGSQFFIVTALSTPHLDGKHTNFGKVVEGIDTVKKIEAMETDNNDNPVEDAVIEEIELLSS